MMLSLAWRNLARNRRRTVLTGFAVATAVILLGWLVGFTYGSYDQMVDQATSIRLGHLQIVPEGYLERPMPRRIVPGAEELIRRVGTLDGVQAVSARVYAQGLLGCEGGSVPAELVGIDPELERGVTIVHEGIIRGEPAVEWCRREMSDALEGILGGDERLFERWCQAAGQGEFLSAERPQAVVLGTGMAKRLVVSVGDEITVQVVRAVGREAEGERAGSRSQRRLVVAGIVASGRPEIDHRGAYLDASTLMDMLGTSGPNEIVARLERGAELEAVRRDVSAVVGAEGGLVVHSWAERDPTLASLIELAKASRAVFFAVLGFLVVLSVANATLMSVLERRREFGVMLALGTRPSTLTKLIMTEVALLGLVAVSIGAAAAAGVEAFGRLHGWPLEMIGMNYESLEAMTLTDMHGTTFRSNMPVSGAVLIVVGIYASFLLTGLWSALQARRIEPADALKR